MRRALRWLAWIGGGLVGLVVLLVIVAYVVTGFRLRRTFQIEVAPVAIPADAGSIERGRHLATTWAACTACHGDRLEGDVLFEDSGFGRAVSPNLTSGEGGVGGSYTDEDWVRAIRHGVNSVGRGIWFMPDTLFRLSDEELGAIVAYLSTIPPVDNVLPDSELMPLGRVFMLFGALEPLFAAEDIDHTGPRPVAPPPGPTAAYGEHIARVVCVICHDDDLAGGGDVEGTDDVIRIARNLTPAGNLANWSEDDFDIALRTGVTPEGDLLDSEAMPWDILAELTDDEVRALWLFLQTLPPVDA